MRSILHVLPPRPVGDRHLQGSHTDKTLVAHLSPLPFLSVPEVKTRRWACKWIGCLRSMLYLCVFQPGSCYGLQIFEGESIFYYPQVPSASVEVPLALKRDAAVTVMIKVS